MIGKYFVSPREQPWEERKDERKMLIIVHVTFFFFSHVQKRMLCWRIALGDVTVILGMRLSIDDLTISLMITIAFQNKNKKTFFLSFVDLFPNYCYFAHRFIFWCSWSARFCPIVYDNHYFNSQAKWVWTRKTWKSSLQLQCIRYISRFWWKLHKNWTYDSWDIAILV